jgi:2-phosphoglycolate phosphatase
MPRYSAVLFDFDGTLADSYAAIAASVNHTLHHFGQPALTETQVRGLVGHGLLNLMETILPGRDPVICAEIYRQHHPSVMKSHTRLLSGVADGLIALQQAGIKMGVCSNKPSNFTRRLCEMLEIDRYFGAIYGPEEAGAAKPDPAMLRNAIARLGTTATDSLYVGDMIVDIQTARNAGVVVWVVPTGSNDVATLTQAGPDRIYPGMADLIAAILNPPA